MKLAFVILVLALAGSASANIADYQLAELYALGWEVTGPQPACEYSVVLSDEAIQAAAECVDAGKECCRPYDDIVGFSCSVQFSDALSEAFMSMITALEVGTGLSDSEETLARMFYSLARTAAGVLGGTPWNDLTLTEQTDILFAGVVDVEELCPYLKGATSGAPKRLEAMLGLGFVLAFGAYVFM